MTERYNHPDPLFARTVEILASAGMSRTAIAKKSGLSSSTIAKWLDGTTRRPQSISLQFALRAAGYKMTITKE